MKNNLRRHPLSAVLLTAILLLYIAPRSHAQPGTINQATVSTLSGVTDTRGAFNGGLARARFNSPNGTAVDAAGNVYVADADNHCIRKINVHTGTVSTFAGSPEAEGNTNGNGTQARFRSPRAIAIDKHGCLYVADGAAHNIRKITSAGVVTTYAGGHDPGDADGTGTRARFKEPSGVAVDNNENVFVADAGNNKIRVINPNSQKVTTWAGTGVAGYLDGDHSVAKFNHPTGVAVDNAAQVYVADDNNHRIRKITPTSATTATVSTLSGGGTSGFANGAATTARFDHPVAIAIDGAGNLYVGESGNQRIRKVSPTGLVTTVAGNGGVGAVNGGGNAATFENPRGVAVNQAGTLLYIADNDNQLIRRISIFIPPDQIGN